MKSKEGGLMALEGKRGGWESFPIIVGASVAVPLGQGKRKGLTQVHRIGGMPRGNTTDGKQQWP